MGHAVGSEAATSTDLSGPDETDEPGNEDESIVHQTASIGDAEVLSISYLCPLLPSGFWWIFELANTLQLGGIIMRRLHIVLVNEMNTQIHEFTLKSARKKIDSLISYYLSQKFLLPVPYL